MRAHTGSDVLVSLGVIASLVLVKLGFDKADPVVALLIALVIVWTAWGVFRSASATLSDSARIPVEDVCKVVLAAPGVLGCHHVRTRGSAAEVYVDLHVQVDETRTVADGHRIAEERRAPPCREVPRRRRCDGPSRAVRRIPSREDRQGVRCRTRLGRLASPATRSSCSRPHAGRPVGSPPSGCSQRLPLRRSTWPLPPLGIPIAPTVLSASRALSAFVVLLVYLLIARRDTLRVPRSALPFMALFGVVGHGGRALQLLQDDLAY